MLYSPNYANIILCIVLGIGIDGIMAGKQFLDFREKSAIQLRPGILRTRIGLKPLRKSENNYPPGGVGGVSGLSGLSFS